MASTSPNNADPERKFARRLASNDLKVRNKALKRLKMYISIRSKTKGGALVISVSLYTNFPSGFMDAHALVLATHFRFTLIGSL